MKTQTTAAPCSSTAIAPLKQFILSPNNVRQQPSKRYIAALAKNIATQALLHNLIGEKIGGKLGVSGGLPLGGTTAACLSKANYRRI